MKRGQLTLLPGIILLQLVLFSFNAFSQVKPVYEKIKGFHDYSKKMNAYFDIKGKKTGEYKQWKRQEWYFSSRLDKSGRIPDMQQLKQTALKKVFTANMNNRTSSATSFLAGWTPVGPNSFSESGHGVGRANRLAFHPTNSNFILAATAGGGLWKTTNGGTSWVPLTDGLPNLNLSGVAMNPLDPNIIYILTGDGDGGGSDGGGDGGCCRFGKFSTGVLKTVDGGITWSYTGLKWKESDEFLGYELLMHPSDFNVLLAATSDGLYKTSNGGSTWTKVLSEYVYDVSFMPNNGLVVYAGCKGGKFFRSQNGGTSWTSKYTDNTGTGARVSIAVTPANSGKVYMLINSNQPSDTTLPAVNTFNGLFVSNDEGNNWTTVSSGQPNVFSGDGTGVVASQSNYNHSLAANPFDQNIVVTGAIRFFQSKNGGSSLTFINNTGNAKYHADIHQLAYSPANGNLYAASDGGVYKSTDDGKTWTPIQGNLSITQYYRISVSTSSSSIILGGSQDNGTHLRNTVTSVFNRAVGADGMDNAISRSSPSIMYATKQGGSFLRSDNTGTSFSSILNDSTIKSDYNITAKGFWLTPIDVSATDGNKILIGYYPLIKGIKGTAWNFSDLGSNGTPGVSGRTFVKSAPRNQDIIYAGDNSYEYEGFSNARMIWRSRDGGDSWNRLFPDGRDDIFFTDLTMNPDNPDEIWITVGGFTEGEKVYRSQNGGDTWVNVSGSLPNIPVNCIVYNDRNGNPDDALYIGTDIGVFYRDNNLGNWIPFSNGLPVVEVTDLEINDAYALLRAGTYGRGIWETELYTASCPATLSFSSHSPSEPYFFSVSNSITSTALITGAGAHIQYKAGQRTVLSPGFRVNAGSGAKFISYVGPCPGGGVPAGYYRTGGLNGLTGYLIE